LDGLFPQRQYRSWSIRRRTWKEDFTITQAELGEAAKRIKGDKKAPGPDGVRGGILKTIIAATGIIWIPFLTRCLREGIFPSAWKTAELVLLRKKRDGPSNALSSFRPICLLDESSKLYERILNERIIKYTDEVEGICARQFGFRRHLSTVDAIHEVRDRVTEFVAQKKTVVAMAVDISNAFNSLDWGCIQEALTRKRIPSYLRKVIASYLDDRWL